MALLQAGAASAAEALLSTQREAERQVSAAAAAALRTEVSCRCWPATQPS